jgi:hypothetical protein
MELIEPIFISAEPEQFCALRKSGIGYTAVCPQPATAYNTSLAHPLVNRPKRAWLTTTTTP